MLNEKIWYQIMELVSRQTETLSLSLVHTVQYTKHALTSRAQTFGVNIIFVDTVYFTLIHVQFTLITERIKELYLEFV